MKVNIPNADRAKQLRHHEKTKKKLDKLMKKWVPRCWLNSWNIKIIDHWNGLPTPKSDYLIYGRCDADWRYANAVLDFDIPACSTLSDFQLERVVIHELIHAVVNEMREKDLDHEERVVSHLENIIEYAYRGKK